MVVDGEDADVVRLVELLRDPRVAVASDLSFVGTGRRVRRS
jgi:hypothetical protein